MFTTLIVQPLFNLLVLIYALLPGHNFGLSIILFTLVIRLLMWPLVKKQLHHTKAMRELQPELKRIKKATKGDRQKESAMVMELYKERKINPFASVGLLFVQIPILIALYAGLRRIIDNPQTIVDFSYPLIQHLSWIRHLADNIASFDATLFGVVDLKRAAIGQNGGGVYWPAFVLVLGSAIVQFYQSKQLMPDDKDSKGLRRILSDATSGKPAESSEVNAAVGKSTRYLIPGMVFLFTINLPAALPLYWLTTGLIAIFQQGRVLKQDETELETVAEDSQTGEAIEGEIIPKKSKKPKKNASNKKRRKK